MALSKFQAEAAALCLKKMLNGSFFSICELDRIGEMMGVSAKQHEDYSALHALHCVHWADMPVGMAAEVKRKTLEVVQYMVGSEVEVVISYPNMQTAPQLVTVVESVVNPPRPKQKRFFGFLSRAKS